MEKKQDLIVVKVGGKIVENPVALKQLITDVAAIDKPKALVHGGGVMATQMAERLGIKTTMVEGRRVTDDEMLNVVTMVYGGLVNKRLVALLQWHKQNAIGLTGADMNIILSAKRPVRTVDYGWVGDVKKTNGKALAQLIESGVMPVIAPLTHDGLGHILNTNADTMAAATATALSRYYNVTLVYCFEKNGVLMNPDDDDSVITTLRLSQYEHLKNLGIIKDGMIPKLDNAFATLDNGVSQVIITKASHLGDLSKGTHITIK